MLGKNLISFTSVYPRELFHSSILIFSFLIVTVTTVHATNGYILHGYGKNKGAGGAGIANPQDALAGAVNPAGSAWVGDRFDITGELFVPKRGYEISEPGKITIDNGTISGPANAGDAFGVLGHTYSVESEKELFMIPAMGIVKQLPHGNAIGLSVYGGGMGTEYNRDDTPDSVGTFFDGSTGVDLLLIMANLHFASKVTDNISVGVGVVGAAQSFKAKGLSAFQLISQGTIDSGEREWAFGAGFSAGIQANLTDNFSVAASYYSKIKLTHDEHYSGLFADDGDFSVPPMTNIGMTYRPNLSSALSFDLQYIEYSKIPASGNKFEYLINTDPNAPLPIVPLGNVEGAGFGFSDSLVYKLGYQFKLDSLPKYTWRVGYAYQDQIIPESGTLFPMLAPATITQHFTAGLTHDLTKDMEINMNFLYAPKETVKGEGVSEGVDIWLEEYGLEFGLGYKY